MISKIILKDTALFIQADWKFPVFMLFLFYKILISEKQYVPHNHTDFINILTKNTQVIFFL